MERITVPVKAILLKADLTYEEIKIKAEPGEAIINKGLYVINPDFIQVNFNYKLQIIEGSEIFYQEFNASPVPLKKPEDADADPSSTYLDDYIYKNALEQTGDPAVIGMMNDLVRIIKPFLEPANLFKLAFFGAVAYQLLLGVLTG